MADENRIFDEIRSLLDAPASGDDAPALERLEHTLTSGYAAALTLEAERWRLERRIAEVAAMLGEGQRLKGEELAKLGARLTSADTTITHLRGMLATLRDRTDTARAPRRSSPAR